MKSKNMVQVERDAHWESRRWYGFGQIVVDAVALLNSVSSFGGPPTEAKSREMQSAMKVAAHSLRPVLDALNDEFFAWQHIDPEYIEASNKDIDELQAEVDQYKHGELMKTATDY
jgi:hypothetical protein